VTCHFTKVGPSMTLQHRHCSSPHKVQLLAHHWITSERHTLLRSIAAVFDHICVRLLYSTCPCCAAHLPASRHMFGYRLLSTLLQALKLSLTKYATCCFVSLLCSPSTCQPACVQVASKEEDENAVDTFITLSGSCDPTRFQCRWELPAEHMLCYVIVTIRLKGP
jgi:hypothetical protein